MVVFALFGGLLLAILFSYVEIGEPYERGQNENAKNGEIKRTCHTDGITDTARQHAEADKVAKRVYLYSETLFGLGAFLAHTGDTAVKCIAKSREQKAYRRKAGVPRFGHTKANSGYSGAK